MTNITNTAKTVTVGTTARPHIELSRNRLGQLSAKVITADGILRSEMAIGLTGDDYTLGAVTRWSGDAKHNAAWAHSVVRKVLTPKRARAAYVEIVA